jgi:hypothetical protein
VPKPPGITITASEFFTNVTLRVKKWRKRSEMSWYGCRLLVRQFDVQADRRRLAGVRALVGRFHDAGAAAGDHREAGVGQFAGDFAASL